MLKVHHDKFSQGGDAVSPSFGPASGYSTNAPASPIPDFSLGRSISAFAPAGLGSPSFAQQQILALHPQQSYPSGANSPISFYLNNVPSRPGSPLASQYHPSIHQHQHPLSQSHDYQEFALTPGAPPHQAQQLQSLRSSLATPPPIPLRPPPSARSSGQASSSRSRSGSVVGGSVGEEIFRASELSTGPLPETATVSERYPTPTSRVSKQISSASRKQAEKTVVDSRRPPGTISLPPSQVFSVNPLSPHMTRGIPMTPSMPGFTFHAPMSTPPLHHHLLSPGLGPFSPPLAFYNPYLNAAPGAPLHGGGQHEPPQSMFAGMSSVFGPSSPHHLQQISPLQHPAGPAPEYFQMPGSPHTPAGYFNPPPQSMHVASPRQQVQTQPSPCEPQDYFAGAVPSTNPSVTPPPSTPIGLPSSGGLGSAGRGSDGTGPSTIPSSSGASSPLGGGRPEPAGSSRGTSLPADSDDFAKSTVDFPPAGTIEHRILQQQEASSAFGIAGAHHGRAKSQSPNESVPSLTLGRLAGGPGSPITERRMSWNDLSGLQRNIARMSLEGEREATIGRNEQQ